METVVMIIMILVSFSFILKLTCHRFVGIIILSLLPLLFLGCAYEFASMQSKTQIQDWLQQPSLMLDTSVLLTVDVAFQLTFCIFMAMRLTGHLSRVQTAILNITYWVPGMLLFPVLFSILVELIFSMPGTGFATIGWGAGIAMFLLIPAITYGVKYLMPESELRLELMFLINILIAALGIVATVNGRTAAAGTDKVNWDALAGTFAIILIGSIAGVAYNKIYTSRKLKKLNR
ncbi:MAG: hypothetical protein K2K78_00900 [Muribaculaceae bacterium]|nr:hypothetical protein [Muribaculaceae bacterium]